MGRLAVGVLISGRGSNMRALIDACAKLDFPAQIRLVISNEPEAPGLSRARRSGIPTRVVDHRRFPDRTTFEGVVSATLEEHGTELVCLAGFMRVVTEAFVSRWFDRLINIHPSLLPAFPGLDTHARALEAGVKIHGCTVHFVRAKVDSGPIIGQAAVPVLTADTPQTLAERVLEAEHALYPLCLRLVAEGRVKVSGERTEVPFSVVTPPLINPCLS